MKSESFRSGRLGLPMTTPGRWGLRLGLPRQFLTVAVPMRSAWSAVFAPCRRMLYLEALIFIPLAFLPGPRLEVAPWLEGLRCRGSQEPGLRIGCSVFNLEDSRERLRMSRWPRVIVAVFSIHTPSILLYSYPTPILLYSTPRTSNAPLSDDVMARSCGRPAR